MHLSLRDTRSVHVDCVDLTTVECPGGSYTDGDIIKMCPRGTYQDKKRQSSCKPCPEGKTTVGIGSVHDSECSVNVFKLSAAITSQHGADDMNIAIGVTLSVGCVLCCVVGALLLARRKRKRMQTEKCKGSLRNNNDEKFQNGSDYEGGKHGSDYEGGKHGSDYEGGNHCSDYVDGKHDSDNVDGKHGSICVGGKRGSDNVDGKHGSVCVGGKIGSVCVGGKRFKK